MNVRPVSEYVLVDGSPNMQLIQNLPIFFEGQPIDPGCDYAIEWNNGCIEVYDKVGRLQTTVFEPGERWSSHKIIGVACLMLAGFLASMVLGIISAIQ